MTAAASSSAAPLKPPGLFARLGFTAGKTIQSAADVPWGLTRSSGLFGKTVAPAFENAATSLVSGYASLQPKGIFAAPVKWFSGHMMDHPNEFGNTVMGGFSVNNAKAQNNFERFFGFSSKLDQFGTKIGTKLAAKYVTASGADPTDPKVQQQVDQMLHRNNPMNMPQDLYPAPSAPAGGDPAPSSDDGGQGGTPSSDDSGGSAQGSPPPATAQGAVDSSGDDGASAGSGDPGDAGASSAPAAGGDASSGSAPDASGDDASGGAPAASSGATDAPAPAETPEA